ncbi:hypothetical protein DERF_011305 [Dermatophagoides farinae]|uniref:Uncharacterized protein n=1 Tax=Dermatophagoides farinae TaxID=6954 RepID=A0A922HUP8_DERFA|nr:hypothetical protein DERF_011305 [Dermatophagoides farinae]
MSILTIQHQFHRPPPQPSTSSSSSTQLPQPLMIDNDQLKLIDHQSSTNVHLTGHSFEQLHHHNNHHQCSQQSPPKSWSSSTTNPKVGYIVLFYCNYGSLIII